MCAKVQQRCVNPETNLALNNGDAYFAKVTRSYEVEKTSQQIRSFPRDEQGLSIGRKSKYTNLTDFGCDGGF